ncbi:hypothetical protein ACRALDRAFT_2017471 [Sodiomyces alcalophilus JCM 7366]|uniref:uncharacterized protein n=1 Tax=Sodiomyces alcalophilus JCM 7366 TaxID=591952 RepID=UPI0039B5C001
MAPTTDKSSSTKRFELPKLNFDFSSLTDGTNIPPPPESPVEKVPTPPKTPLAADTDTKQADAVKENGNKANGAAGGSRATNGSAAASASAGTDQHAGEAAPPLSPAPSSRAGSIRRFLSITLLNHSYAESETQSTNGGSRPISRNNGSTLDEKKAKRSSGFFRRLRTGDAAKRSSTLYENADRSQSKPEVRGPPPPMIPELSALGSKLDNDGGSLGGADLFKDINMGITMSPCPATRPNSHNALADLALNNTRAFPARHADCPSDGDFFPPLSISHGRANDECVRPYATGQAVISHTSFYSVFESRNDVFRGDKRLWMEKKRNAGEERERRLRERKAARDNKIPPRNTHPLPDSDSRPFLQEEAFVLVFTPRYAYLLDTMPHLFQLNFHITANRMAQSGRTHSLLSSF